MNQLKSSSQARRHEPIGSAAGAEDQCPRYRIDVIAASAVDVVQSAGGWLFDRARAGWAVSVLLAGTGDTRSLRILGLRAVDLNSKPVPELLSTSDGAGRGLAVSAEVFTAHNRIREEVFKALEDRLTAVTLWGPGWPGGVDRKMTRVEQVLSPAARAFKRYALAAAGSPCEAIGPTETLLCDPAAVPVERPSG